MSRSSQVFVDTTPAFVVIIRSERASATPSDNLVHQVSRPPPTFFSHVKAAGGPLRGGDDIKHRETGHNAR
ncbi:hypothetical protein B005_1576 [Nocardiopsis alba ATCC BAA-2165]|uniref:Uncharacterized protein n=1 Tax=Nocardiopsis alba (strain ATCC BAA-2165 / BE74) TaxID=1205910 RepID=J7L530_NOCAA|nr:hypothetical protein B005_1576 [Nocardiopsis alba ATCC BAA-2165]